MNRRACAGGVFIASYRILQGSWMKGRGCGVGQKWIGILRHRRGAISGPRQGECRSAQMRGNNLRRVVRRNCGKESCFPPGLRGRARGARLSCWPTGNFRMDGHTPGTVRILGPRSKADLAGVIPGRLRPSSREAPLIYSRLNPNLPNCSSVRTSSEC